MAKKKITTKSSHGDETTVEVDETPEVTEVEETPVVEETPTPKPPANSSSGMGFCDSGDDSDWRGVN